MKWLAAYAAVAGTMLALDLLWIGWLARPLYLQGIGHLMAEQPNLAVAALFYLVYAAGLLVFALAPNLATPGLGRTAVRAALFGLVAYATYDLTNLATLKGWPVGLALLDVAWGCVASATSAVAGRIAFDRIGAG